MSIIPSMCQIPPAAMDFGEGALVGPMISSHALGHGPISVPNPTGPLAPRVPNAIAPETAVSGPLGSPQKRQGRPTAFPVRLCRRSRQLRMCLRRRFRLPRSFLFCRIGHESPSEHIGIQSRFMDLKNDVRQTRWQRPKLLLGKSAKTRLPRSRGLCMRKRLPIWSPPRPRSARLSREGRPMRYKRQSPLPDLTRSGRDPSQSPTAPQPRH